MSGDNTMIEEVYFKNGPDGKSVVPDDLRKTLNGECRCSPLTLKILENEIGGKFTADEIYSTKGPSEKNVEDSLKTLDSLFYAFFKFKEKLFEKVYGESFEEYKKGVLKSLENTYTDDPREVLEAKANEVMRELSEKAANPNGTTSFVTDTHGDSISLWGCLAALGAVKFVNKRVIYDNQEKRYLSEEEVNLILANPKEYKASRYIVFWAFEVDGSKKAIYGGDWSDRGGGDPRDGIGIELAALGGALKQGELKVIGGNHELDDKKVLKDKVFGSVKYETTVREAKTGLLHSAIFETENKPVVYSHSNLSQKSAMLSAALFYEIVEEKLSLLPSELRENINKITPFLNRIPSKEIKTIVANIKNFVTIKFEDKKDDEFNKKIYEASIKFNNVLIQEWGRTFSTHKEAFSTWLANIIKGLGLSKNYENADNNGYKPFWDKNSKEFNCPFSNVVGHTDVEIPDQIGNVFLGDLKVGYRISSNGSTSKIVFNNNPGTKDVVVFEVDRQNINPTSIEKLDDELEPKFFGDAEASFYRKNKLKDDTVSVVKFLREKWKTYPPVVVSKAPPQANTPQSILEQPRSVAGFVLNIEILKQVEQSFSFLKEKAQARPDIVEVVDKIEKGTKNFLKDEKVIETLVKEKNSVAQLAENVREQITKRSDLRGWEVGISRLPLVYKIFYLIVWAITLGNRDYNKKAEEAERTLTSVVDEIKKTFEHTTVGDSESLSSKTAITQKK